MSARVERADRVAPEGVAEAIGPSRMRRIVGLALPIVGAMASQNVLNLVDVAMVGGLGDVALAAVGMGSFVVFAAGAIPMGLAAGVQAVVARRYGQGLDAIPALNGGLLLAVALGLPLTLVLVPLTPMLFPFLNRDPAVVAAGVPYVQIRLLAAVAVGMNFAFRGYWTGVNAPRVYLRTLIVMHAANVVFDWALIYGRLGAPALGTVGAGIASILATLLGSACYFGAGLRHAWASSPLRAGFPDRTIVRTILRLSVPAGMQQLFFAAGFAALYWIVGRIGTPELAATNVLINVVLVAILPGMGLGLAATSLVGQALGRDDAHDAKAWGWDVAKVGAVCAAALALPFLIAPGYILAPFLHHAETLALARTPLRLVGLTLPFDVAGLVLLHALFGAGDNRRVLLVSIALQWGLFLPIAWVVGPFGGYGLLGVWLVMGAWRIMQAGACATIWQGDTWASAMPTKSP